MLLIGIATILLPAHSAPRSRAASPAAQAGSSVPATVASAAVAPPLVTRNATIALKVSSYDQAVDAVTRRALAEGAELMDSKTFVDGKGRKHGWMRLRVEAGRLDAVRAVVWPVGKLYSDGVDAEDQRPDYEALSRRVDQLQIHQQRLEGVLGGNRRLRGSDILFIQDRLFRAGTDQQDLLQQQSDMQRRAGESLVYVELFEPYTLPLPPHTAAPLAARFASSRSLAHSALVQLADRSTTAVAYLLTFAPIWIPVLIVLAVILRWLWRRSLAIRVWMSRLLRELRQRPETDMERQGI